MSMLCTLNFHLCDMWAPSIFIQIKKSDGSDKVAQFHLLYCCWGVDPAAFYFVFGKDPSVRFPSAGLTVCNNVLPSHSICCDWYWQSSPTVSHPVDFLADKCQIVSTIVCLIPWVPSKPLFHCCRDLWQCRYCSIFYVRIFPKGGHGHDWWPFHVR